MALPIIETKPSPMSSLQPVIASLHAHADTRRALISQRFFKTAPGQYGEGDIFIGVTVPHIRRVAAAYPELLMRDIQKLLYAPIHEERFLALVLLTHRFRKGGAAVQKQIYTFYMQHIDQVNNWDLVDLSAHWILGGYLHEKNHEPLHALAQSSRLWQRRIAIVATLYFIRKGTYSTTLRISSRLLQDHEDLIHKAVGWMLREVGKRAPDLLTEFLDLHSAVMPRTMLRYAIERCSKQEKEYYMAVAKRV